MDNLKMRKYPSLSILVAGDFMIDCYLYSTVSRISPEAPVPVAKVQRMERRIGGAGNVALNILAMGSQVRVLTCVGVDSTGRELIEKLREVGADVAYIYRDSNRKTSLKTRIVAQNQQLLRYDEEEVTAVDERFLHYINSHIDEIFTGVQGLVLSDYGKGVLTSPVSQFIIQAAKARGLPVLVDPKGMDYSKYSGVSVCTPNLKELTEASGSVQLDTEQRIHNAALAVCDANQIEYMLVTRSEKGMSLISRKTKEKSDFPAVEQEVCDVTGAGDTVISTMAICMTAGYPLELCCRLANMAASVVVSKFGAETATVDEINAAIQAEHQKKQRETKICTLPQGVEYANQMRKTGKKVVFTNGCFDLVHAGHIAAFRQAHSYGDVLIVGVNSDSSVRRLKGPTRPVVKLENRLKLLEALELVDCLIPFDEDTPQALIEAIKPDVLVKGKDWEGKAVAGVDVVEKNGGRVAFVDLEQGLSTTAIVEKIRSSGR